MCVEIDEARCDDDAVRGHPERVVALEPGDRLEDPVGHDDLARPFPPRRGIDQPGVADLEVGARALRGHQAASSACVPASRYSNAIRTATPFVTWSVMTDCEPAATSAAISTPSFIGPGCMTSASGCASASRSAVRP